jgi:predicted RNase H-like nuclease
LEVMEERSAEPGDRMLAVTGVDGCARGWVAVTLGVARAEVVSSVTVAATLDGLPLAGVTGIDMPLGLLGDGWRDADLLARRALGRRGVTVFAIPPRPVWECETYAEANRVCRDLTGKGFSVQAWGLRRRIAEAEEFRRASSLTSPVQLYEVHPELAFAGRPAHRRSRTRGRRRAGQAGRRPAAFYREDERMRRSPIPFGMLTSTSPSRRVLQ